MPPTPPGNWHINRFSSFEDLQTFLQTFPTNFTIDSLGMDSSGNGGFVLIYH